MRGPGTIASAVLGMTLSCAGADTNTPGGLRAPRAQLTQPSQGGSGGVGVAQLPGRGGGRGRANKLPRAAGSRCQPSFLYGINYAWREFGGDFGGVKLWNVSGVSANRLGFSRDLEKMRSLGARSVRWWMFPELRSDALVFAQDDTLIGTRGTLYDDVSAALDLAHEKNVRLSLTLFSFDSFRASRVDSGLYIPTLRKSVVDPRARLALLENLVRPLVRHVENHPRADRLLAWELMNEPEWAIAGASLYGDPDFTPNKDLTPVTHRQMASFLGDLLAVIQEESSALTTIGSAAMKWKHAWQNLDTDFHQFHLFDWANKYWPYSKSPTDYGLDDKPVVMGEFPLTRNPVHGVSYDQLVDSWHQNGYAGALGWAFNGASSKDLQRVKHWSRAHGCGEKP